MGRVEKTSRSVVDENGVWLYHDSIGPGLKGFWVEAKDLREGDVSLVPTANFRRWCQKSELNFLMASIVQQTSYW